VRLRTSTALLIALVAATAAGCGSEDEKGSPLPEQAVVDLESRLDEVERRMTAGGGACADITNDSAPGVDGIIQSLPSDVDPDVRQALEDGFSRLFTLTAEQCDETQGQQTEPEPAPQPAPETETETETIPPETIPTETTPTIPEEPPVEPLPQEEDSGGDGGNEGDGGAVSPEDEG
jgi:hypothetical protein